MSIIVKRREQVTTERGSCGFRRRLITAADNPTIGISEVRISDAREHFHPKSTEIYYVLSGTGTLDVNGDSIVLEPGTSVLIPPGLRHRAVSTADLEVLVIMAPPFAETNDIVYVESE